MMLLKNSADIDNLVAAVEECERDVYLRSADGEQEYNLKSVLSRYVAIGELCKDHGDEYEIFCSSPDDIPHMLKFFHELRAEERQNRKCA